MVQKTYCDYCGVEVTNKQHLLEITINGDETDICDACGTKVTETLSKIEKKE